jgi:hypothetical protein
MAEMSMRTGIRMAIGEADELSRRAHAEHHDAVAQVLDGLRTTFVHIDEAMGGGRLAGPMVPDVKRMLDELDGFVDRVGPELREAYTVSMAKFRTLASALEADLASVSESLEIPSRPLFGVLPLSREIPQDVHSMLDYASAGICLGTALAAESTAAKFTGAALGASGVCVSALTDHRLSAAKVIPIEAHEAIDHLWGAAAIAAPFALGYWKKDPAVAAVHVLTGASMILTSLFTDYRAARGVGR